MFRKQPGNWCHQDQNRSNSKSSRKLAAPSPELKIMDFANHRYMGKIFHCLEKKLGMSATNATFSMDAHRTNVCVYADSVLRVGQMKDTPKAVEDGKNKWKDSGCIRLAKMQWVSMEKQLNSSGKDPKIFIIVYSWRNPKKTRRSEKTSQRSSQTGSFSCECSITLYGTWVMRIVFRMQKQSRITQWNSHKDIGHSGVLAQKKSGMEVLTTLG